MWVVREKGKIKARRIYSKKLTKSKMFGIYKQNKTLYKDYRKLVLSGGKTREVSDLRSSARRPSGKSLFVVEVKLSDGHIIHARSQQHDSNYSKKQLKMEAMDNARRMASYYWTGDSDSMTGNDVLSEDSIYVKEGVVHYEKV